MVSTGRAFPKSIVIQVGERDERTAAMSTPQVTEIKRCPEPVTHDTFIDDLRSPTTSRAATVREPASYVVGRDRTNTTPTSSIALPRPNTPRRSRNQSSRIEMLAKNSTAAKNTVERT